VAATLHDVGMTVSYYRHHKHGYYLVGSEPLPGFSHREQGLLMLLVRFHHRGRPRLGELKSLMAPGDKRLVRRLAACLRLAEHLEASRAGRVHDVEVEIGEKTVVLRLVADGDAAVEMWETAKQGALFQRAFGRTLELEALAR
jgi:exopolyphosphatase/guanosine-5'-triphosphate,3'-diphosphate pyrophosphatase